MKLALTLVFLLMFPLCGQATPIFGNVAAKVRIPPQGVAAPGVTWMGDRLYTGLAPFTLSASALLDSVDLWFYDTSDGSAAFLRNIQYAIYEGSGPGGAVVAAGSGTTTSTVWTNNYWRVGAQSMVVLQQSFALVPVSLEANTQYCLAITAMTDPSGVSNNARWAEFDDDTRAIILNGVVPEASSVSLILVGALSLLPLWRHTD